jgi:cell division protein FtsQ
MNARFKGLIFITVNLLILLAIGISWIHAVKNKRIEKPRAIEIKIETGGQGGLLEPTDVQKWVLDFYKKDVRKVGIYALKLDQLEKYLVKQPLVRKADLYVDPHNTLHIELEQRKPLVRVVDVQGNQYYLDEVGYKIPVSSKYGSRVLVATGLWYPVKGDRLDEKGQMYYGSLLKLVAAIEADTFAHALIEQVDLDANGDFTLIPKIGQEKILIGGADAVEDKLERLKLFYQENMGRQGWNVYETINLKFKGQIVGKKENLES